MNPQAPKWFVDFSLLLFSSSDSIDSLPLPLIPKAQKDDGHTHNPQLRQRNIQIKAMESMDRAETEEDEDHSRMPKLRFNFEEKSDKSDDDVDTSLFDTYLIIEFANTVNSKSLRWIVNKIRGKRSHGGAELILRKEPKGE